jgi:sugar lactone lactonase YvrE
MSVQGRKSGLLLEYDPETGESKCVATGFWFANGVDISADGSYAIVGETFGAAVHKHWLQGPKV